MSVSGASAAVAGRHQQSKALVSLHRTVLTCDFHSHNCKMLAAIPASYLCYSMDEQRPAAFKTEKQTAPQKTPTDFWASQLLKKLRQEVQAQFGQFSKTKT